VNNLLGNFISIQENPFQGGVGSLILQAGPVAKSVLLILLFCSLWTWSVFLYKWYIFNRIRKQTRIFEECFSQRQPLAQTHTDTSKLTHSLLAQLFRVGYAELQRQQKLYFCSPESSSEQQQEALILLAQDGLQAITEEMQSAKINIITYLELRLSSLATIASTSPFIGLFGTVWGIMNAFRGIGIHGQADIASVAPGIAEALVTTAGGLAAAVPAVIIYNHFIHCTKVEDSRIDSFSIDFLNLLKKHIVRYGRKR